MEELSHLPIDKQNDILKILEIIKEVAVPEKVILFGSFARGDWVDDEYMEDGIIYSYKSDFDFLVVTQGSKLKEFDIRNRIENRTRIYKHPVNPLVHELEHINYGLERGQYFFKSIIEDGILLYDTKLSVFAKPRALSKDEQKEQALLYYENWIESGLRMFSHVKLIFESSVEKEFKLNEVLFLLHQTVERLYAGLGLIYTGFKPKTHSIKEYRNYTKFISNEINEIFCFPPSNDENRVFNILQKGYIDARYKADFKVEQVDLECLIAKVEILAKLVVQLTNEKINSL
ncbi:HEPN domain-containing protein [Sphingobacterium sp. BN32]|uniref:HEPN domain-containing protein n=1 Tax=Sphingobacterium sp. BN32 TaxID=3058432 RepID=UPI00265D27A0|nr:HEPN domain-containing protein [Sphingobacterium sp. BN32]WKK58391.1 HEPN domain-containing protein [Sphingobacterium sp. BN32]